MRPASPDEEPAATKMSRTISCSAAAWLCFMTAGRRKRRVLRRSRLHAPAPHRAPLDGAEDQALDDQADRHHGEQAGEHVRGLQQVAVLEYVPAEPAAAGGDAEHQLG